MADYLYAQQSGVSGGEQTVELVSGHWGEKDGLNEGSPGETK